MKAFEEWWSKQEVSGYNPGSQYAYEMGWRAALECVLNKMNTNRFMDNGELRTFIEKELEVTE